MEGRLESSAKATSGGRWTLGCRAKERSQRPGGGDLTSPGRDGDCAQAVGAELVRNGRILDSPFLKSIFKIHFIFNVLFKNN